MREKQFAMFYKNDADQIAITLDDSVDDINTCMQQLNKVSKTIGYKLNEMERENTLIKKDLTRLASEVKEKDNRIEDLQNTCEELLNKLTDLQEKYDKEVKRANLLEVENNRTLDELKVLRKERNELVSKVEKKNTTLKDKIKNIINNGQ